MGQHVMEMECPRCGSTEAFSELNTRTQEEWNFCPVCGWHHDHLCTKGGRRYEKHTLKPFAALRVQSTQGQASIFTVRSLKDFHKWIAKITDMDDHGLIGDDYDSIVFTRFARGRFYRYDYFGDGQWERWDYKIAEPCVC